jgi:hypothetical protein
MKLGNSRCQCLGCDEYFNSVVAFDKHRVDALCETRRCLTPKELLEAGLSVNKTGFWITKAFTNGNNKNALERLREGLSD